MPRIVGFEGTLGPDDFVTHGAAAIEAAGVVTNSFTKFSRAKSDESTDGLTSFGKPWESQKFDAAKEIAIVAVRSEGVPWTSTLLLPDLGRLGGVLGKKREKPFSYIAFRDRSALAQYASETATKCANAILSEEFAPEHERILRAGLTLEPRNPLLLALRTSRNLTSSSSSLIAERLLAKRPSDLILFKTYLAGLCVKPESLYYLKYEDGDQRIGGLNVNTAIKQLTSLDALTEKLKPVLVRTFEFLDEDDEIPEPRFQHLRAASAELGFGILGRTPRERLTRYLELELLGRVFRGEIPPELKHDSEFAKELRSLLTPPGGASLKHRPIDASVLEVPQVNIEEETESIRRTDLCRMRGFVQGFFREVSRAELRLGMDHTEFVSIELDDRGQTPEGIEPLRSGEGLFASCVFTLMRSAYNNGRVKYHLRKISHDPDVLAVDALPSSIQKKALFLPKGEIVISPIKHSRNLAGAVEALGLFQSKSLDYELKGAKSSDTRWLPAPPAPETSLHRVLEVLGRIGALAELDEIVLHTNELFDVRVRSNNTRRVIRDNPDLFVVEREADEEASDRFGLSDRGRQWLECLRRYGTLTQ